ncbi:hypothetical protein SOVF_097130 isoform A [Spinacia oleracea]|nr:hypothetical protein SOVF_097130 isoform A [Spinacia oleracea]
MTKRIYRTIYVGNLPGDIREREVEDIFYKYGPIVEIDLKVPPRPPGYAFVEFEDERDAEDAVHGRNGYDFDGHRLRVEFAHGGRGSSSSDHRSSYSGSSYRGGAPKHTDYRVMVTGLPSSASWQDLKDHMRRAGEVCFSDVFKDRRYGGMAGVVEYASYDDMKRAVRKLDDSEFRNAFSRAYIRVKEDSRSLSPDDRKLDDSEFRNAFSRAYIRVREDSRSLSLDDRSRSRSYNRGCSYSRSRSRSHSISPRRNSRRSYSRSPSKSGSRSPSRSRSSSLRQSGDWTKGAWISLHVKHAHFHPRWTNFSKYNKTQAGILLFFGHV